MLKGKLIYIIALILIFSGAFGLYIIVLTKNLEDMGPVVGSLTCAVKIVMGLCIIFDPKKNLLRAVGFYAFALGFSRLLASFPYIGNPSPVMFIVGLVFIGMACNLMISGINYLNDTSRSRNGMTRTAALLALLQIGIMVYYIKVEGIILDFDTMAEDVFPYVISTLQYVTLLVIMDTEELRFGSHLEKSNTRIESIRTTYALDMDMMIPQADADILLHMFDDRSSWTEITDGGPAECEKRLKIVDRRVPSVMILQKWRDSDKIHVTVVNDDTGTMITANRFSVTDVLPEGPDDGFRYIRLFDDGRMLSQIWVSRQEVQE